MVTSKDPFAFSPPLDWPDADELEATLPRTPRGRGLHRFFTNPSGMLGSALMVLIIVTSLSSHSLASLLLHNVSTVPSLGSLDDPWVTMRPAIADSIRALQPTLTVGLCSGVSTTCLGLAIGGVAGYFGGWIDALLSRLIDFGSALPFFPFTIAVITATGSVQGILGLIIIFSLLGWVGTARLVRAQLLILREQTYTEAAQAAGIGHMRILVRHLFPIVYPTLLVAGVLSASSFMLAEATLDFFNVGVANTVTLGSLLGDFYTQAYALAGLELPLVIVPGILLWLLVLSLHLISEGVQHALDVREVR